MSIKSAMDDVEAFHVAVAQPVRNTPCPLFEGETMADLDLRSDLIGEEEGEIQRAIFALEVATTEEDHRKAMADLADGLADLIYVCIGTALQFGIPLDRVWKEVHRSNMAKVQGGVRRRDDGKILKPEGWTPPDVEGVLYGS